MDKCKSMGLDAWLDLSIYIFARKAQSELQTALGAPFPVKSIVCTVCYWRKAYNIHNWFVRRVHDDALQHDVRLSIDDVRALLSDCEYACDHPDAPHPMFDPIPQSHFDSYEKDEWYFDCLRTTKEALAEALPKLTGAGDLTYSTSY